jgi:hypothetical protein
MIHALLTAVVAAAGWSTPQVLSNGDIALGPELSMAPSGAAIAVWDHESGPDCAQVPASLTCAHIVEFSQRPSPLGWDYPREVARPGIGARPQVAVNDAGRAAIIWVHDIGRDRVVQATYRTGANEPFPNPNDLSAAVLEVRDHHVGLDAAGNVAAVWAERHSTDFDVAAEIRSAATGTWGAPVVLSTGYVRAGPSLAVTPGGDAFAVWVEGSAVLAAHGNLAGGTWETPITLSQSAGVGASVAVNAAGDAVAVWTLGDRPGIGAAARPAGGSWGSAVLMNDYSPLNGVTAPRVAAAADGTAVAVWVGGGRLRSSVRSRDGSWSRPDDVGAAGAAAPADPVDPSVALDSHGNVIALWIQRSRLFESVRPAVAGAWQPSEQMSDADASAPRVALDGSGNGFAVWNLRQGDALPAMTSTFPAAAWVPTLTNTHPPAIRGRARVGRTFTCARGNWAGMIPIAYSYRWLRNGHARPSGRNYQIRRGDVGSRIACRVIATNAAGKVVATSPSVYVG